MVPIGSRCHIFADCGGRRTGIAHSIRRLCCSGPRGLACARTLQLGSLLIPEHDGNHEESRMGLALPLVALTGWW